MTVYSVYLHNDKKNPCVVVADNFSMDAMGMEHASFITFKVGAEPGKRVAAFRHVDVYKIESSEASMLRKERP